MSYLEIIEQFEKEQAAKSTYTWQDFYPGLNPKDWNITESARGVHGEKISGQLAGTIAFYISRERLAAGPSTQPEPASWEFKRVRIGRDTWIVGVADTGAETAWFVKDEVRRQGA